MTIVGGGNKTVQGNGRSKRGGGIERTREWVQEKRELQKKETGGGERRTGLRSSGESHHLEERKRKPLKGVTGNRKKRGHLKKTTD